MRFRGPNGPKGQRRNYAQHTTRSYLHTVEDFALRFNCSPDRLGPRHIREYQAELFQKRKLSPGSVAVRLAALRFFYTKTLQRGWSIAETPYPKKGHGLPAILSQEEVARLIQAAGTSFHRTLLMTLYATGARNAELTRLKFSDVDKQRMVVHIQGGKGRKDRDVMLSSTLLEELREHWHRLRRKHRIWSFLATTTTAEISPSIPRPCGRRAMMPPKERVSRKACIPTPCATASPLICSRRVRICVPFRSC
jgi:integrase/recombinase XerD